MYDQSFRKDAEMKTLEQLAELVDGQLVGDANLELRDVGTLQSALNDEITFLRSARYTDQLAESSAAAAIVPLGFTPLNDLPHIQVADPETAFTEIASSYRTGVRRKRIGAHARAFVSATAVIDEDVSIYPGAFIGDHVHIGKGATIYPNVCIMERCKIGANVSIFPNAVLYEDTQIGDDTIIHAGAVLGGFGFGYASNREGHKLCNQIGYVEVGSNVEIGCNSTVDRGTYGATRIGNGSKLDNLVQIGHNCQIGEHNMFCAQVGIAGSSVTGSFVVMAGQVGISDHIAIGDRATLGAQSGVMHDIGAGQTLVGSPALPVRKMMQVYAVQSRLPELRSSIKQLNQKLDTMNKDFQENLKIADTPEIPKAKAA